MQALGMAREGRASLSSNFQPRLVAGLAVCQVQPCPSSPTRSSPKTEAPSPLEPGLHPGPGVVASCPAVGKSGSSPCGS